MAVSHRSLSVSQTFARARHIPARARRKVRKNISRTERVVSIVGGTGLALTGLQFRSLARYFTLLVSAELFRRGITGTSYLYRMIGWDRSIPTSGTSISERSTTIYRPRPEVYRHWKNFDRFPSFMKVLQEAHSIDNRHSHWVARGPFGIPISWNSEILEEKKNELIHWRTVHPSRIQMEGRVYFSDAPQGRGTEVRTILNYRLPGGKLGNNLAFMMGFNPDQQNREILRHFKQFIETGETVTAATRRTEVAQAA